MVRILSHGEIFLRDGKIGVRFCKNQPHVEFEKALAIVREAPDRKYERMDYTWYMPATPWHAKYITDRLRPKYKIGGDVLNLANTFDTLACMSGQTENGVEVPGLFSFQQVAVHFIELLGGRAIIGDAQGTGKTIEALAYIAKRGLKRALVVAPVNVLYKWKAECEKWVLGLSTDVVLTLAEDLPVANVHVMSYAIMTRRLSDLLDVKYDILVLDEFHAIKNLRLRKRDGPVGSQRAIAAFELAKGIDHILCLSGTPMLNRPIELFSSLHMVDPKGWPDRNQFAFRYGGGLEGKSEYGNKGIFMGATNLPELKQRLRGIMIRRSKQEVLPQLPPLRRTILPVDINRMKYEAVRKECVAAIKELQPGHKGYFVSALDKISSLRYTVGMAKIEPATSWVEDFFAESTDEVKLVVFCHHREVLETLRQKVATYGTEIIIGGMGAKEREKALQSFRHPGGARIMLVTSAGGEGIDLFGLDGVDVSTVLMVERTWVPAVEEQVESRLHRYGQSRGVNAYYLTARKTIDEYMANLVEEKRDVITDAVGLSPVETFIYRSLVEWLRNE